MTSDHDPVCFAVLGVGIVKQHQVTSNGEGIFTINGVYEVDGYETFEDAVNGFLSSPQAWWYGCLSVPCGVLLNTYSARKLH